MYSLQFFCFTALPVLGPQGNCRLELCYGTSSVSTTSEFDSSKAFMFSEGPDKLSYLLFSLHIMFGLHCFLFAF